MCMYFPLVVKKTCLFLKYQIKKPTIQRNSMCAIYVLLLPLTIHNVFVSTQLKHEKQKSSNKINFFLRVSQIKRNEHPLQVTTLRLLADGCAGQNINSVLITMLMEGYHNDAPQSLKYVEVVFPVVGHRFTSQRVFGNIENVVKKVDTLVQPQHYFIIFLQFDTRFKISSPEFEDDWRKLVLYFVKRPLAWHFQFNPSKRKILNCLRNGSILVRIEIN